MKNIKFELGDDGKWAHYCNSQTIKEYENYSIMLDDYEMYPAEIVSNLSNLKIYTDWKLSKMGLRTRDINDDSPEINLLDKSLQNIKNQRDVLCGCVSKFNLDDIKYFCEVSYSNRNMTERQNELEKKVNYSFGWVLSEPTLIKIENHVNKHNIKITEKEIKSFI